MKCWLLAAAVMFCVFSPAEAAPKAAVKAETPTPPPPPEGATRLSHGRFHDFLVFAPGGTPKSFVLYLEGKGETNEAAVRDLVAHGAMVASLSWPQFKANLEADGGSCMFADGDLENLSHFVQAYFHNPTYLAPILVGSDAAAPLAYAMLVQAPRDTFDSALTLNFCPELLLKKPLCKGSGYEDSPLANGEGYLVKAAPKLGNPWVDIATPERACPAARSRQFIASVHGAAGIDTVHAAAPFSAAFAKLASNDLKKHLPPAPDALGDLPVVTVPAQGNTSSDLFALLMSGDGGWAGLDQDVAAALSARGIPVVGLDSLRYFWTPRTPDGIAADTDKLIRFYLAQLHKSRVLLVGYSQGADVLPFAVNRLPKQTRSAVALAAILGMSEHALFEFHVANWISDSDAGPATLPEVDKIRDIPLLCVYGADESDSLCPKLDATRFKIVKMKGGHHFDGDYAGLAREILNAAGR
jgi:type IV secretory pathway VirJ component